MNTTFEQLRFSKSLEWLDKCRILGSVCVVYGLSGVGKSRLISEFEGSRGVRGHWIYVNGQTNISAQITVAQRHELVVWEDVHLLSPEQRSFLIKTLRPRSKTLHVLISQEEIVDSAYRDVPKHKIQPFTENELQIFLSQSRKEDFDVTSLMERTGGLPSMVNLYLLTGDLSAPDFKEFGNKAFQLLGYLSVSQDAVEIDVLKELMGADINVLQELHQLKTKLFVEFANSTSGGAQRVRVFDSIRVLFLRSCSDISTFHQGWLNRKDLTEQSRLWHVVGSKNIELFDQVAEQVESTIIQNMPKLQLRHLAASIDSLDSNSDQVLRWRAACRYILGERDNAVGFARQLLQRYNNGPGVVAKRTQMAISECLGILNRSGRSPEVLQLAQPLRAKTESPESLFIDLEYGVALINSHIERASEHLQGALRNVQDLIAFGQKGQRIQLLKAKTCFQLGRALDLSGHRRAAEERYLMALEIFDQLNQPYFSAVTQMNLIWVAFYMEDWTRFRELKSNLEIKADLWGYDFIRSGLKALESVDKRLHLDFSGSLNSAMQSLQLLKSTSPMSNMIDSHIFLIRSFIIKGHRYEARHWISRLKNLVAQGAPSRYADVVAEMEFELTSFEQGLEDVLQKSNLSKKSVRRNAAEDLQLRLRGHKLSIEKEAITPWDKLVEAEGRIVKAIREDDEESVWAQIGVIERIHDHVFEPTLPLIACHLLKAERTTDQQKRQQFIDSARLDLIRVSADKEVKAPLVAWLESLKENGLARHPSWLASSVGDRERWAGWTSLLNQSESTPSNSSVDLVIEERTGEVFLLNQPIKEFQKRPVLRRLLKCLLQASPSSLGKEVIVNMVWAESYDPRVHDSRIYTSIQRIRKLIGQPDWILSSEGAYSWIGCGYEVRVAKGHSALGRKPVQNLILEIMSEKRKRGEMHTTRLELSGLLHVSDATLKRELKNLVERRLIQMDGNSRSVVYSLSS